MPTSTRFYAGQLDYIDKLNQTVDEISGGGSSVTSVGATSPVLSSGGTTPTISMPAATTSVNGYLTSADWNTFNGKLSSVPNTAVTAGSYGNSTQVATFTVGADGRLALAGNTTLTPAWTSVTGKPTFATVATTGAYSDLTGTPAAYSLPTASTTVLGGVKVDGSTITISSGVISAVGGGSAITVKDEGSTLTSALTSLDFVGAGVTASNTGGAVTVTITGGGGSGGTVTSASVVSANGFAGTVANATTTPAITISTSVTGLLKGNGTALSAAAAGTDYSAGTSALGTGIIKSTTGTGSFSIAGAGDFPTLNQNTTGTAANITGIAAVANGGTGLATLTSGSVLIGAGTSNPTLVAPSTAGNVLTSNGSTWVSSAPSGGGSSITTIDVSTTDYGQTTTLPDATTLSVGAARSYRNSGGYPRRLKDYSGKVIGFIPANSSVLVAVESISTSAGVWHLGGAELVAVTANKGFTTVFGGTSVLDYSTEVIDSDRQIFFAKGSTSLYGVVYDHTNNTWGSPTLIRTGGSYTGISIKCGTDKILHLSCDTSTSFSAVVLSISGTSITVNTAVTATLGATFSGFGTIKEMNVGGFIVSMRTSTERYIGITVSGTTPTLGTEVSGASATAMGSMHDLGSGVVLAFSAGGSALNAKTMTLSGATLTANNTANVAATSAVFRTLEMSTGRVAVYYLNTIQKCGFVSVSGTTPSFSVVNAFTTTSTNGVDLADMVAVSSTTVGIATAGGNTQNLFTTLTDTSGTASVGTDLVVVAQGGADSARLVLKSGTTVFWEVGQAANTTAVVEVSYASSSATHTATYSLMPMSVTRTGATPLVGSGNNPQSLKSSIGVLSISTITSSAPWQRLYNPDGKGITLVKPIAGMIPSFYMKGRTLAESWISGNTGGLNLCKVEVVE